jgi:hypothetical protein
VQPVGPVRVRQFGRDPVVAPVRRGEPDGIMEPADAPPGEQHDRGSRACGREPLRVVARRARKFVEPARDLRRGTGREDIVPDTPF